jgi:hypothetical protein
MAGIVHVPWYATVFRGDKLEAALSEMAPIALRYGATSYAVHRNRDDAYKLLQMSAFDTKEQWEAYWYGPEFNRFRAVNQALYQVPILYSWADLVIEGYIEEERQRGDLRVDPTVAGDAQASV